MAQINVDDFIQNNYKATDFSHLHWNGSFQDYVDLVVANPKIARNAFQRVHDMILSFGTSTYTEYKKEIVRYHFFDDPIQNGKDAVFGIDVHLMKLVNFFKSAAAGYGTEKRVLLLHGPVGSAKSSISRLLKKGLEHYSKTDEGALYTFEWIDSEPSEILGGQKLFHSPMHEEPLKLIPLDIRKKFLEDINKGQKDGHKINIKGEICPADRYIYTAYMEQYKGDWTKMVKHVRVKRLILSEKDRIGIGTFQPKDEKNQDSTELTGDINYRKIAQYGSDSDPRAFNFDGEFNIANRGIVEFIEMLKLDVAFLYDLLGASQEQSIKPKKFAQTDIDEVILGHTNEPEFRKLQNNEFMEALRDRTVKIDVPYITRLDNEVRIYKRDFNSEKIPHVHIAPHTIEMAATWSILTRLEEPKKSDLTMLQKLKLYNGKTLPGYNEDNVKELRKEAVREGLDGISPRYIQDKLSNALVKYGHIGCLNPFMVFNELEAGLKHHSLVKSPDQLDQLREQLAVARQEYEDTVKNDVQKAISVDESAIQTLCANYIDNVKAYTQKEKIRNKYSNRLEDADERFMRSIEEKIDIPESRKEDFRREIMNYIGALAIEGKQFDYKMNERLHRALELKLFEDQKDSIKLTTIISKVVDKETQEKIDVIKSRLIKNHNYCEICATDALNYVASIFAKGDSAKS
ncbi:MAG: serine protein kinase [Bdellovibrio sp. CG12_big_fil_rev_8_21_14_0_65_39_13]|nr:MAG: serine protein kinase [Bdellovibrio sp. CG22_combo_CG10-13_8_21_14_all_39_27]PIQ61814.1 MAG: serine protein kinase [Bdellovibrio sp. CG12_big_fil_rev_8_21_14_0_65_39_13]PIR35124.1 MAG: serine protein kinase [Bdellovibrio sp. CG11_big_fil_rev_8_21_14_0_20_39_38]